MQSPYFESPVFNLYLRLPLNFPPLLIMKPAIFSEYAPLSKVLIHTPGAEHEHVIPWEGDHPLMGANPRVFTELQRDHSDS